MATRVESSPLKHCKRMDEWMAVVMVVAMVVVMVLMLDMCVRMTARGAVGWAGLSRSRFNCGNTMSEGGTKTGRRGYMEIRRDEMRRGMGREEGTFEGLWNIFRLIFSS